MSDDLQIDDLVRLHKPHPCGSFEWRVVRVGADIGLKCQVCGRRILLNRSSFKKRVKKVIHRSEGDDQEAK